MISFAPLRQFMKRNGLSTYTLRYKYGFASGTVKSLMKDESVSTYTVGMLCEALHCDIHDIIEYVPDKE